MSRHVASDTPQPLDESGMPGQRIFYDDYWTRTEDQRAHGPMARHTRRLILRILQGCEYRSVVDVGCGEGSLLRALSGERSDLLLTGTDLSPHAVELAARKNPDLTFRVLDLERDALPRTFDLVVCSEVIEHIADDRQAIRNLTRMTGRYLTITTLGGRMRRHEPHIGHLRNYDPEALQAMVAAEGLEPVRMFRWGWPFFSPLYRDFQGALGSRVHDATTGEYGVVKKLFSQLIYTLFLFNLSNRGDQLVLLAKRPEGD